MLECKGCGASFHEVESHCRYCGARLRPLTDGEQRAERERRAEAEARAPKRKKTRERNAWQDAWDDFQSRKSARGGGSSANTARTGASGTGGGHTRQPGADWRSGADHSARAPGAQEPLRMFQARGSKSKLLAFVLAVAFGTFGAHWFYLGSTARGVLYALFFWTLVPTILGIRDAVRLLMMDDAEFSRRYG